MKPRIVFFSTPEFGIPALKALARGGYDIAAVVTQPDKRVGRGLKTAAPPVKVTAEKLGLKVFQPAKTDASARPELERINPDLGITVAYGKIIPQSILDIFPLGVMNIHPSLLPKYRGPSPIPAAILNGDKQTGITLMRLDAKMDHGPILAQSKLPIADNITGGELSEILARAGAELLADALPKYLNGKLKPLPQNHSEATYTKILTRVDGHIDWSKSAEYIERMIRAYNPSPGAWSFWQDRRIKILRASMHNSAERPAPDAAPGFVFKTAANLLAVHCLSGFIILDKLQLQGKRPMLSADFLHGHPRLLVSILK